jgi:hypothetical protein
MWLFDNHLRSPFVSNPGQNQAVVVTRHFDNKRPAVLLVFLAHGFQVVTGQGNARQDASGEKQPLRSIIHHQLVLVDFINPTGPHTTKDRRPRTDGERLRRTAMDRRAEPPRPTHHGRALLLILLMHFNSNTLSPEDFTLIPSITPTNERIRFSKSASQCWHASSDSHPTCKTPSRPTSTRVKTHLSKGRHPINPTSHLIIVCPPPDRSTTSSPSNTDAGQMAIKMP